MQIARTRQIARLFLPSREVEMSEADRARIWQIYQGGEWRALARGSNGSWHAVADAPSEEAAIAAALDACAKAGEGCRLHAIGNFTIAEE
jgi:hypothetical protein